MPSSQVAVEWKEDPSNEYWDAEYAYKYTFDPVTVEMLSQNPYKIVSPAFGDGRWHVSIGTILKAEGFLGVFLGVAIDFEVRTSKHWLRRCISCTANLGTPLAPGCFGLDKNISGGYTFHPSLESRRGQAKYLKLDKLFEDASFIKEQKLQVHVMMKERRQTYKPTPFGDIISFSDQMRIFLKFFDNPSVADVVFIFPRRNGKGNRTIYAQKEILRKTLYFRTMFDSGFLEGGDVQSQEEGDTEGEEDNPDVKPVCTAPPIEPHVDSDPHSPHTATDGLNDPYHEDSDLEIDELEDPVGGVAKAAGDLSLGSTTSPMDIDRPSKKRRLSQVDREEEIIRGRLQQIVVRDIAYTTYKALILYLYSNSIAFAPLISQYEMVKQRLDAKGRPIASRDRYNREMATKFTISLTIDDLQPTSPKSMYILADMLQLPELRDEALKLFKRCLLPENLAIELGSPIAARYEAVGDVVVQYLKDNWAAVSVTPAWKQMLDEGLGGLSKSLRDKIVAFLGSLRLSQ